MFYIMIQDSFIGVFTSAERLIPWMEKGIMPYQCMSMFEVEEYLRNNLSFDDLFDFGWEEELSGIRFDVIMPKKTTVSG